MPSNWARKIRLLDGGLTFNGDVFYYDYKGYQISQIVDRTSINLNFDATVKGVEIESTWEPMPGLEVQSFGRLRSRRLSTTAVGHRSDGSDRPAIRIGWC